VTLEELMVSTLAMVDAVTKLLIEKGVISEAKFRENFWRSGRHIRGFCTQRRGNEYRRNTDLGIV